MVEYGLLVSRSSEIILGFFGQLQNLWDATLIPYGRADLLSLPSLLY
jgi:hypothetical protein